VHPWLWFLTRQSNSRIFQNMTVPEIVASVFKEYGTLVSYSNSVDDSLPERDFCCQYRETDFNFISRLLEQEGIYYFVEHDNGRHSIKLVNKNSSHAPYSKDYGVIRFDREDREHAETLGTWFARHEIQPARYTVNDYNPYQPRTDLTASAQGPATFKQFEYFDYPAEFVHKEKGSKGAGYAQYRLEELHSRNITFTGSGHVRGFQPGCSFRLERHPVDAYNDEHVVVGAVYACTGTAESSGAGAGFEFSCSIEAVPAKQQYRPPRITPKPIAQGLQTAVVVGPSGEEIYTDKYGRIKVQFRWDRYGKADADSSCWIRLAQAWAGNKYGALALPRIGQEVLVEFLEGDPDRPLVTGSVYNGDNMPPYTLPDNKTVWGLKSRSSPGGGASNFNELRFEDKSGKEEVYLHAEKDHTLFTKNRRTEFVGEESHLNVKSDVLEKFEADQHRDVTGDDLVKLGGGLHLTVGQDWQGKIGTKFAADAGQEIHLKAGMTLVLEAGSQLSLKVGGSFITLDPSGVTIQGPMVKVNSGGSAGSGSGASPKTPKNAKKAHDSEGGQDKPISKKALALKNARGSSTPFCEICD
jgi:type VI secretion system secreted protein VgrG